MILKFRGKKLSNDEFVYGGYCVVSDGIGGMVSCIWETGASDGVPVDMHKVDIGTGVYDACGIEIFENDILRSSEHTNNRNFTIVYNQKKMAFELYDIDNKDYMDIAWIDKDWIVVGNVYDGINLLIVEKE